MDMRKFFLILSLFSFFFSSAQSPLKKLSQRSAITFDTDAQAYITAAGITSTAQKNAVNTLVVDLKAISLWTSFKAIYPLMGGTSSSTKYNLVNPLDTDAAFRIAWNGTVSFQATGVKGDGSTGYGNTFFTPSVSSTKNDVGIIIDVAENLKNASYVDMGSQHVSTGQFYFNSSNASSAEGRFYGTTNNATGQNPGSTAHSSKGLWYLQRISDVNISLYKSAGLINVDAATTAAQANPTRPVYVLAYNSVGTLATPSPRLIQFIAITEGLTQTEVAAVQIVIEKFLKTSGKYLSGNKINRDILGLGDSFMAGSLATVPANAFINLLATYYGQAVENRGAGGEGAFKATDNLFSSMLNKSVNPYYTVAMFGFNDLRRSGSNAKTYSKLQAAAHTIISHQFINRVVSVQDATVTKTNWATEQVFETYKYKYVSPTIEPLSSDASGATLSWDFTGTNVVVGAYVTTDTYDALNGPFTIHVDGVLKGTYDLRDQTDGILSNGNPNKTIPKAIPIFGLSTGAHTIVITSTTATPVTIDYLATMYNANEYQSAVTIGEISYMTPTGYATGAGTNNATTPIMQAGTDAIRAIVDEYIAQGYPVTMFPTNDFLDLGTDIDADNVHPNDSGHDHIFDAIQSVINP